MKKSLIVLSLIGFVIAPAIFSSMAMGAEPTNPKETSAAPVVKSPAPASVSSPTAPKKDIRESYVFAIMGIMGAAVLGGTISLSVVGAKVVSGVVRNPGARSAAMPLMLLCMALIESVVIYGLVVTVLLYAKL
ncbi:ATP synthase F0 subunit C [Myxococcota bacterium]|nr:ATP synthase F0 subunit C [Myxococcota bacterium]MBU1534819.1 ATP synthase F0 subunit C [Myxococcota bacterium]